MWSEGPSVAEFISKLPTATGILLGFIVNELIPAARQGLSFLGARPTGRGGVCAQTWEKIRPTSHAAIAQPAPVKKPTQNQTPIW
jgi:hypothetical protein